MGIISSTKWGDHFGKGGGGTDPLFSPPLPLNPPLLFYVDYSVRVTIRIRVRVGVKIRVRDLVRLWYVLAT